MFSHEAPDYEFNTNALLITAFVRIKRLQRIGEVVIFFWGRQGDESETASGQKALTRQ